MNGPPSRRGGLLRHRLASILNLTKRKELDNSFITISLVIVSRTFIVAVV